MRRSDGRLAEPPDRFLRRHGRDAQGAARGPGPGHDARHLDQPLSRVPDPFGCGHDSYAAHNNNSCCANSSTGSASTMNSSLRPTATPAGVSTIPDARCFENFGEIMDVMLPTLREERRQTYSPVLPISHRPPARSCRCRSPWSTPRTGMIRYVDPTTAMPGSSNRSSRAAQPSCSGRSTGRRAGSRSASIMKCRARI